MQNLNYNLDFTASKYEQLCLAVAASGYRPATLAGFLERGGRQSNNSTIIMRHDIDRNPRRALLTAEIEYKYGIQATYYFRYRRETYVPDILDKIASQGHEIGYHYETVDKCRGNLDLAIKLFGEELGNFRTRYKVTTVCAHGNPLTRFDNKTIWETAQLSDFGLLGEAFLSLDFNTFAYYSDSGRTWINSKSQKMPGKDSVATAFNEPARNTNDVIMIVSKQSLPNICILTHPERWSADLLGFTRRYLLDLAFSFGKSGIYAYRRLSSG